MRAPTVRREAVDRAPVLLRLDTAVSRATPLGQVVLVQAAPGYGKSTLLAGWAAHIGAGGTPVAWYNLSPGDRALPVFLTYLEAALRSAIPGFAPASGTREPGLGGPISLADDDPDFDASAETDRVIVEAMVTPLLAALENVLGGSQTPLPPLPGRPRLLLVLDDVHCVAGHPAIDAALTFLMRHQPGGLVLALSSRRDLGAGLPLARLRSSGRVTVLGEQELRLLPGEIARAFPLLQRAAGTRPVLAHLIEKQEGWPLGLHTLYDLLGDSHAAGDHHDPDGRQLVRRATDELYTYFDEEALSLASESLAAFLLHTAVLDEISIPGAQAVTEANGSEAAIAEAVRQHLFVRRTGIEPPVYSFHTLFCEFLLQRLGEVYGPDERRRLHRRAAAFYAETQSWMATARQFLAAGDVDAALAAVNAQREQIAEQEAPLAGPATENGATPREIPTVEQIGAKLRNAGEAPARRRLIELLGLQAGAEDIPFFAALAEDDEPSVRSAAQMMVTDLVRRTSGLLRINMFGGLRLWRGEEPVAEREWRRKRAKLLLVYLMLAGPEGAARQTICAKVWPDDLPGEATDQFYAHLRALRAVLEPGLGKGADSIHIKNQQGRYAFAFECPHHWDLAEFLRYRDLGRRAERLGQTGVATAAYEAAVALYTGEFLPEPPFSDVPWLYNLRLACREDMISMRTFLAERAANAENWEAALTHWKAILRAEPAREVVHVRLMTVYAWLGRRDDALAQYQLCRSTLRRELNADPLASTTELYQQILNSEHATTNGGQ